MSKDNKAKTFIDQTALDNIKAEMPRMIELARIKAQIQRSNYLAYIEAGFDKKEALELCKDVK